MQVTISMHMGDATARPNNSKYFLTIKMHTYIETRNDLESIQLR